MLEPPKRLANFGPFAFDFSEHVLWRGEETVELTGHATQTLEHLIENAGRWISKEDLKTKLWPDVSVSDASIYRQISDLRRALGDSREKPQFIDVEYKKGYRFIAHVSERVEAPIVAPENDSEVSPDSTVGTQPRIPYYVRYARAVLLFSVIVAAAVSYQLLSREDPRVIGVQQLTSDGAQKSGPLLSNGRRIFFAETRESCGRIVSVPVSGGDLVSLEIPLKNVSLQDISRDGSTLLLQSTEGEASKLWAYSISTRVLRLVATGLSHAAWSPDRETLAANPGDQPALLIYGKSTAKRIDLPGEFTAFSNLKWSPDGTRLRFSLLDSKREWSTEWEIGEHDKHPHRLALATPGVDVGTGAWSRDGRYFLYCAASRQSNQELWALPERASLLSFGSPKPVRLTHGEPGSWNWPSPSLNGSTIFAISHFAHPELARFDKRTNSWQREWGGAGVTELSYSRDGNWVAYTRSLDHTIWKAKPDGTQRIQLASTGEEAHQPHWSPDGTRIAYMALNRAGKWRIFLVSADGGVAEEALPAGEEQGVPTWSPDGSHLLFGELLGRKPKAEMSMHLLDVSSRTITGFPGSKGLWSPRWSPNGAYVAAVTSDSEAIRILSWPGTRWNELVRMRFIDNMTWSVDSQYVYFNGRDEPAGPQWVFRVAFPEGRLERLVDLTDFPGPRENWFGVGLDGAPLALRAMNVDEICALKCILP